MKKVIFTFVLILVLLTGCNTADNGKVFTDETAANPDSKATTIEQTITQEDTEAVNNQHANERTMVDPNPNGEEVTAPNLYRYFELEVEYANDISFEVDYNRDENEIKAEIEDEVNNVFLSGNEAKNSIIKNFELLTFDEKTEERELVTQILTAFNLNGDFIKMDLEVKFNSGIAKEYKIAH